MVSRDLFNKMAILALVAILLAAALSLEASAAEDDFHDSGPPVDSGTEILPDSSVEELPDNPLEKPSPVDPSDELVKDDPGGVAGSDFVELLAEISGIRQSFDIFLYFAIPYCIAALFVYKFCVWFYYTFIGSVL